MKFQIIITIVLLKFSILTSQTLTNQINSNLVVLNATAKTFNVIFNSTVTITGIEIAPMNIWIKIPDSEAVGTTITYSGSFGFSPGFNFSSGGYSYFNFQSLSAIPANTFQVGIPVNMGIFDVNGPAVTI